MGLNMAASVRFICPYEAAHIQRSVEENCTRQELFWITFIPVQITSDTAADSQ